MRENKNLSFVKNGNIYNLLNKKVEAYFDTSGMCRYISISPEAVAESSFIGVLIGSETDIFNENTRLKVLVLEPEARAVPCKSEIS